MGVASKSFSFSQTKFDNLNRFRNLWVWPHPKFESDCYFKECFFTNKSVFMTTRSQTTSYLFVEFLFVECRH